MDYRITCAGSTLAAAVGNAVQLFHVDELGTWTAAGLLDMPGEFPRDLALAPDLLLVGVPTAEVAGLPSAGHVVRFRLVDGAWVSDGILGPPLPAEQGGFGSSVATDGTFALVAEVGQAADDVVHAIDVQDVDADGTADRCQAVGEVYCAPASENSSGRAARILAVGSAVVAADDFTLVADDLPRDVFGIFLASSTSAGIPLGDGTLCLFPGAKFGRFAHDVRASGEGGSFHLQVDLSAVPSGSGTKAMQPGDTWCFQTWFRDGGSSNLTDAVQVTFE